jgi:protein-disulfide isomerase
MSKHDLFTEKYATPISIVVAGVFIAVAIIATRSLPSNTNQVKTADTTAPATTLDLGKIAKASNVNQKNLESCIANQDTKAKVDADIAAGKLAGLQGTPHMVVSINKNGVITQFPLSGAQPKNVIEQAIAMGAAADGATINPIQEITANDHVQGNLESGVTIIEYSDIDCPFCKRLHPTLQQLVDEGKIAWVYRHSPIPQLHPDAYNKAITAECFAKLGNKSAFWNYLDATTKI